MYFDSILSTLHIDNENYASHYGKKGHSTGDQTRGAARGHAAGGTRM